jgi:hypothetical protein
MDGGLGQEPPGDLAAHVLLSLLKNNKIILEGKVTFLEKAVTAEGSGFEIKEGSGVKKK